MERVIWTRKGVVDNKLRTTALARGQPTWRYITEENHASSLFPEPWPSFFYFIIFVVLHFFQNVISLELHGCIPCLP